MKLSGADVFTMASCVAVERPSLRENFFHISTPFLVLAAGKSHALYLQLRRASLVSCEKSGRWQLEIFGTQVESEIEGPLRRRLMNCNASSKLSPRKSSISQNLLTFGRWLRPDFKMN